MRLRRQTLAQAQARVLALALALALILALALALTLPLNRCDFDLSGTMYLSSPTGPEKMEQVGVRLRP